MRFPRGEVTPPEEVYLFVTNPPTAPWLALLTRLRRGRAYTLVYDLYPDLAQALGVLSARSWPARLFDKVNVAAFRATSGVIALGADMQAHLHTKLNPAEGSASPLPLAEALDAPLPLPGRERVGVRVTSNHPLPFLPLSPRGRGGRGVRSTPIHVIPNWADGDLIAPRPKRTSDFARRHGLQDKTVFLYAGNLGLFQDLETLIDAVERMDGGDNCRLVFVGDGGKRKLVEAAARRSDRVMVFDYVPYEDLGDLYAAADAGLIAIEPGVELVNMPSKTYSILAAGRPFIAVAGASRDLRALEAAGAGIVVNNAAAELAAAMTRLHAHPRIRARMGATARRIFEDRYTREHVTNLYAALLSGEAARVPQTATTAERVAA